MNAKKIDYIIVGAGLAGVNAVRGIRSVDSSGTILIIGSEAYLPYHRPPLTKGLWSGKKKVENIFVENQLFYAKHHVEIILSTKVNFIDPVNHLIGTDTDKLFQYRKLLLCTGGIPRQLPLPNNSRTIVYYRNLNDYQIVKEHLNPQSSIVIIGGGFIGSELAASLNGKCKEVHLIFPEKNICNRIFPEELSQFLTAHYRERGVVIHDNSIIEDIQYTSKLTIRTSKNTIEADLVVAGIGIDPETNLAKQAGLELSNGILVKKNLQTSHVDIYAAGDIVNFNYGVSGTYKRVEHWDNAIEQGVIAGQNMAGDYSEYTHLPYFFSDLFEYGYEAVGDTDSRMETESFLDEEYARGVIYYLDKNRIKGVLLWNVFEKIDAARMLIVDGKQYDKNDLRNLIRL